jgi:Flp pilus assembly CpaF family ATPase
MRKTPKRVFVSELRAPAETVAFLQTIASGHPGAITSQHGEEPDAVLNMLVSRAVQGGWGAIADIAEDMVFSLVHVLVFVRPITSDMRRVTRIVEVVPRTLWERYGKFRDVFCWDAATDTHQWVNDPLDEHLRQWEFAQRVTLPRRPTSSQ